MPIFIKTEIPDAVTVSSIITVFEINMDLSHEQAPDIHDFWEIVYVDRGQFKILLDGDEKTINEGECMIYSPLTLHVGAKRQEVDLRIMTFESESKFLKNIANRPLSLSEHGRACLCEAVNSGVKCFSPHPDKSKYHGMLPNPEANRFDIQRIKKSLEIALLDLIEEHGEYELPSCKNYTNHLTNLASDFNDFLKHNIGRTLTLEDMADSLSISISKLNSLSKTKFGLSPISYFISLKIDAAKRLMRESELNFTEISERLGFNTVHYFSALFKKRVGMTPSEYAKSQN